jgi:phosphatidylglycerophosphate synthase
MIESNPKPVLNSGIVAGPAAALACGLFLLVLLELVLWRSDPILVGHLRSASLVYALISLWVWTQYPKHSSGIRFGLANTITLGRAVIISLFAGFIGHPQTVTESSLLIALMGTLALILDGVDGWIARRTGTAGPFGGRFDMELDGFFILILCLLVIEAGRIGWWILWSGLLRYLYLVAVLLCARLRQPLEPRKRRQAVAVIQTAALLICLPPLLGKPAETVILLGAVSLLTVSFATDAIWLLKHDPDRHPINGQR